MATAATATTMDDTDLDPFAVTQDTTTIGDGDVLGGFDFGNDDDDNNNNDDDDPLSSTNDLEDQQPPEGQPGQRSQSPQEPQFPTNMNHLTTIDGRNMWQNWKRNFTSPLMAVWDLVDNAFDAAEPVGGRLQIFPDPPFNNDEGSGTASTGNGGGDSGGLVLMNTSAKAIKDIDVILKPYSSSKTQNQDAIGENGIGVKQAAATLSDLSFVITKNDPDAFDVSIPANHTVISFGIIAKKLQNPNGVYFPSTKISVPSSDDELASSDGRADAAIERALRSFVTSAGQDVQLVLAEYGGSLDRSIQRLTFHIKQMIYSMKWSNSNFVYCMIIHDLLHGGSAVDESSSATTQLEQVANGMHADRASRVRNKTKAWTLMEEIHREAPRQYLHVDPSFTFEIGTNGDTVSFSYWQRRLAEFTGVYLPINRTVDNNNRNDLPLHLLNEIPQHATRKTGDNNSTNTYNLKVYCAFDTLRVTDRGRTDCLLFVYSRKSGRLVKMFSDARSFLGLSNTSDGYCQGLTIIVDDVDGMLPLNPTKQDLAFSEQAHGAVHEKNIKTWIRALSKSYWDYHCKKFGQKKLLLKQGVIALKEQAQRLVEEQDNHDLDGTLDNFPILQMAKPRPVFHLQRMNIKFDGFTGTAMMRLSYPTKEELDRLQRDSRPAPVAAAPFLGSQAQVAALAAAAGLSVQEYLFNYGPGAAAAAAVPPQANGQAYQHQHRTNNNGAQQRAAKKRRTMNADDDSSSGSEVEEYHSPARRATNNGNGASTPGSSTSSRYDQRLQESRREVIKLKAELVATKSTLADVNQDLKDKNEDLKRDNGNLKKENEELKELIIEMRDKKNDYKAKYKKCQEENRGLHQQLQVKRENAVEESHDVDPAPELPPNRPFYANAVDL